MSSIKTVKLTPSEWLSRKKFIYKVLKLVLSGGQNGADLGGVRAAKKLGIPYDMLLPKGFKTLDGPKPEYVQLYNATEDDSADYPPRTRKNVMRADITLRFASDFNSTGEKCTLTAIKKYNKEYFDINRNKPEPVRNIAFDLINRYKEGGLVINIAGNSEKTSPGIGKFVEEYCGLMFAFILGYELHDKLLRNELMCLENPTS